MPSVASVIRFSSTWATISRHLGILKLMCLLHVGILGSALGLPIQVGRLAPVAIGALFVILGSLLPRFLNFFFGIRTPWRVWPRTHRVGAT